MALHPQTKRIRLTFFTISWGPNRIDFSDPAKCLSLAGGKTQVRSIYNGTIVGDERVITLHSGRHRLVDLNKTSRYEHPPEYLGTRPNISESHSETPEH